MRSGSKTLAELRPANEPARKLFAKLRLSLDDSSKRLGYHRKMISTFSDPLKPSNADIINLLEKSRGQPQTPLPSGKIGCYRLGFDSLPLNSVDGWTIGFNSSDAANHQDNALLLSVEGDIPTIICSLSFHTHSGALVLSVFDDDLTTEYFTENGGYVLMKPGDCYVLYQTPSNRIRLLQRYEYDLTYVVNDEDHETMKSERNKILGYEPKDTGIFPPRKNITRLGTIVLTDVDSPENGL